MTNRILPWAALLVSAQAVAGAALPCPTTEIAPDSALPAAAVGANYNQAITADGSSSLPYGFAITSGLPAGSGLDLMTTAAASANLTGTPAHAGRFLVTLTATDANGCSGGRTYAFDVARGDQTIGFTSTAPANAQVGGAPYTVAATASSHLPVTFAIDAAAASVCSIAGASVSFQHAGTCVIDADQAGDADWNAAPRAQQSFAVGRTDQTISFTSTAPATAQVGGATYTVAATATSGLAVTFTIDPAASAVCSISGSTVSFIGAGTCVVDADQAGDANWNAAPRVQQSFAVGKGDQTISFTSTAPANAAVGGAAYTVSATATSGLPVALTVDPGASGVCSIAGASVTFQHVGTCVLNADQAGSANWNAAPRVQQSFAVGKGAQTIAFTSTAPANAKVGGAAYAVAATASSGLAVTFTIDPSASAVCSISGSSVSFNAVGTCVIDADQAGNADWNAAPRAQQSFAVGKGDQTIGFTSTAPANAQVGGAAYSVAATATSGLAVTFTIDPSASAVCSISGSSVSFIGAGTCVIDADQAGNANWNAAPRAQQGFAVGKANQTISFTSTAPVNAQVGGAGYTVAATATSGLAVTFTIDPSAGAVCSIAGSTVSFIGAGTCVIDADQAGNANYNAAPRAQQTFAVGKGSQTIGFTSTAPANAVVGGAAYTVAATATSGLPVALTVDPSASSVCSIAGASVTFQHAGTCVLNADQSGNANWNAAPRVQQSFAVGKGAQTIAFGSSAPAAAAVAGPAYSVVATASSGLPVTLTIDVSASAVCTLSGSSVSFIGAGTCVIDANQAGDANWNAAPQAQQSFAVGKGSQTIAFTSTAPAGAVVGDAGYTVAATASSGLPVTFSIDPSASAVCSISGSSVSFIGAGTCLIDANQPGDANWNAAPQAQQSVAVGKGSQTITFTSTAPDGIVVSGTPYVVSATASSGLPVTFSIDPSASAVCSISGSTVSYLAAGTCIIQADQAGDANWNAAAPVQQSFTITSCITLSVGQVVLGGGADVCVRNTDGASAEFMYLPINEDTATESTLSLTGSNIVAVVGPPNPISPERPNGSIALTPLQDATDASDAFEPHAIATPPAFPDWHQPSAADLLPVRTTATPLAVGQLLDLNASVGDCGATPSMRKGRVEAITTAQSPGQPLLYAVQEVVETTPGAGDWHAPVVGGFTQGQFQNLIDAFVQAPPGSTPTVGMLNSLKTGAMDLFTNNFGAVSDIDGNGGVIVFFTPALNALAPPASSLSAPALFQVRDLYSSTACPGSNQGEIIYVQVPDPTGVVNSNVRTVSAVYGGTGPALVHHFEHLINASRRLYANGAAPLERMWLDEALAWSAQELVFFNASVGLGPRGNIALSSLTTGPNASVRVADFNTYENPMYGYWRTYFYQLGGANGSKRIGPLRQQPYSTGTIPDVHENAAPNFTIGHAFLRYALDRKNTGDAALFQALVNTQQVGMANLQAVIGVDPNEWMRDFLVALYIDDTGVSVSAQYTTPSWNFRSVYGGLGGFPLAADQLSNNTALTFALGYGGGARYTRFGVAAGQDATVKLTQGGGAPGPQIKTALVRTK